MIYYDKKEEPHIILPGEIPGGFKSKFLGKGANGECFLTDTGAVFKQMKYREENYDDIVGITKLESDYFAFPKELVYQGERSASTLVGYTMDYVDGVSIRSLGPETNIRDLINALANLEHEIAVLSKDQNLVCYDLNYGNMLYQKDKKEFKVVDTDLYYFDLHEEYPYVLKQNIKELSEYILYYLAGYYDFKDYNINLYFEICVTNGKARPSRVLTDILNALEKEMHEEVNTLGDFKANLQLIKRS